MDTYFFEQYQNINYPRASQNRPGLRNAQLGAIHAISSFFTLRKVKAAIVVMPTSSGKTAVLMMIPFVVTAKRVLVVTPSRMVRGQIVEDFSQLITLNKATVVNKDFPKPVAIPIFKYAKCIFESK